MSLAGIQCHSQLNLNTHKIVQLVAFFVSLVDVQATDKDLQGTGLTDPIQPEQEPALLADVGENLLLIPEPTPSHQVPPAPPVAPLPPSQQTVSATVHQQQQPTEDIEEALAQELTSKISLIFFFLFF